MRTRREIEKKLPETRNSVVVTMTTLRLPMWYITHHLQIRPIKLELFILLVFWIARFCIRHRKGTR